MKTHAYVEMQMQTPERETARHTAAMASDESVVGAFVRDEQYWDFALHIYKIIT